jgi:hypothetical protein
MKDLALKRFGISAICVQTIALATDYTIVSHDWGGFSHLSRLLPLMLVAISVPIAVIGLTRDQSRLFSIMACVFIVPIVLLIGGFHGVS